MPSQPPQHLRFWLVVHGSYAPGGDDHFRLSDLRGQWHRGTIPGTPGQSFADMLASDSHEQTDAWALELASKPDLPWEGTHAAGNTPAAMYDRWATLDDRFGESVVRVATDFTFSDTGGDMFSVDTAIEPRVVQANTYGSVSAFRDGRYDAPHPSADPVDLWREVVAGEKYYEPGTFLGMINDLPPERYDEVFVGLPNSATFIARLRRLAVDHTPPAGVGDRGLYFVPQQHNAVDHAELLSLAQKQNEAMSAAIEEAFGADHWQPHREHIAALDYRISASDESVVLGDLHYELTESFAEYCEFAEPEPWTYCLAEACYSIAASYDLSAWLTQDWIESNVDLEPLYLFWRSGGRLEIDAAGVCHVTTSLT